MDELGIVLMGIYEFLADEKLLDPKNCIGYIPRDDNETIASLLEMGWTDIFECRISKLNPDAHPENCAQMS